MANQCHGSVMQIDQCGGVSIFQSGKCPRQPHTFNDFGRRSMSPHVTHVPGDERQIAIRDFLQIILLQGIPQQFEISGSQIACSISRLR